MRAIINKSEMDQSYPGENPGIGHSGKLGGPGEKREGGPLSLCLRGAISLALMSVILWQIDTRTFIAGIRNIDPLLYGAAFLLVLMVQVISARSWLFLLRVKKYELKFSGLIRVMFMGSFFGTFLPSSAGSDVMNSLFVSRLIKGSKLDSVGSLLTVRMLGIFVLLLFALGGSLALPWEFEGSKIFFVVLSLIVAIITGFLVIRTNHIRRFVERITTPIGGG